MAMQCCTGPGEPGQGSCGSLFYGWPHHGLQACGSCITFSTASLYNTGHAGEVVHTILMLGTPESAKSWGARPCKLNPCFQDWLPQGWTCPEDPGRGNCNLFFCDCPLQGKRQIVCLARDAVFPSSTAGLCTAWQALVSNSREAAPFHCWKTKDWIDPGKRAYKSCNPSPMDDLCRARQTLRIQVGIILDPLPGLSFMGPDSLWRVRPGKT